MRDHEPTALGAMRPALWESPNLAGRVVLLAVVIWLLLLVPGCAWLHQDKPQRVNAWLAEPGDLAPVRRVAVLPFSSSTGVEVSTEEVGRAFREELAKLQRFEIVSIPAGAREDREILRSILDGRYSTDGVVALCERYRLDGLLIGTVTSYRPYKPPHLGIQASLLSVHSGGAVWATNAHYDANDLSTWQDIRHWNDNVVATGDDLHGPEMALISPKRFTRFVAHRVVATWRDEPR